MGNYIPFKQPTDPRPPTGSYNSGSMASVSGNMSDAYNYGLGCQLHGMPTKCSTVMRLLGNGSIAGGVISGAGSPMASLMGAGVNLTVDSVYTAAVRQVPGSSAIAVSRIVEGSSIDLTFLEKESHYEPLNIVVSGLSMAPGRQPGIEPNQQPQKLLNNPPSLEDKRANCRISVQFTGKWDKNSPNGPGTFLFEGETIYGLGFTANVIVNGEIGRIGRDVNPSKPFGKWRITQETFRKTVLNGKSSPLFEPFDVGYYFSGGELYENPVSKVSEYDWYDHPGYQVYGTNDLSAKYDFTIRASDGKNSCVVSFHVDLSFSAQGGWLVRWGRNF